MGEHGANSGVVSSSHLGLVRHLFQDFLRGRVDAVIPVNGLSHLGLVRFPFMSFGRRKLLRNRSIKPLSVLTSSNDHTNNLRNVVTRFEKVGYIME